MYRYESDVKKHRIPFGILVISDILRHNKELNENNYLHRYRNFKHFITFKKLWARKWFIAGTPRDIPL